MQYLVLLKAFTRSDLVGINPSIRLSIPEVSTLNLTSGARQTGRKSSLVSVYHP